MKSPLRSFVAVVPCSVLCLVFPNAVEAEEATGKAPGSLVQLTPPVSIKPHPIKGEGHQRMAGLEVSNNTGKDIESVSVEMFFLNQEGEIGRSVPHKESWTLGNPEGSLAEGESKIINVFSAFMRKDTASVDGLVTQVTWKDGSIWPDWTGPAPKPAGDAPVVVKFLGVVGTDERAKTVVAAFNVGSKAIEHVGYSIAYLDSEGKSLGNAMHGESGPDEWLLAGKSAGLTGCTSPPPAGTAKVELSIGTVIFEDQSTWKPASP